MVLANIGQERCGAELGNAKIHNPAIEPRRPRHTIARFTAVREAERRKERVGVGEELAAIETDRKKNRIAGASG